MGDQQVVAHQDAYILKLIPVSQTTTVAAIEVAVDGRRWVPLRVQVFAKGASGAALFGRLYERFLHTGARFAV